MLHLPNACYCSELHVYPKNWNSAGASLKKNWYIYYRFHDPAFAHHPKYKYGYLRVLKGMNKTATLSDRRFLVARIISHEMYLLKAKGYNPITSTYIEFSDPNFEVDPQTPFIQALRKALEKTDGVKGTLVDMASVVNGIEKSAIQLHFQDMPIGMISRKYIKVLLEQCGKNNKRWSGRRHNMYRSYLMKLFKELIQLEAVDNNPVRDIIKAREIKRERVMPTMNERRRIDEYLKRTQYNFWRLLQCFYHSGSRETELMNLQGKDVNLIEQTCKYIIKKGPNIREVRKPIKDTALPLWIEIMKDCKPNDYIFSKGLVPGPNAIRPDQLGRRWTLHVKKALGIEVNLYSLKHLHSTESMDELEQTYKYDGAGDVAKFNGHTSTAMVIGIYDTKNKARRDDRIKGLRNTFS